MHRRHSILDRFNLLRGRGEKALVLFFTAGDPSLEDLPWILETLQEAGADVIEVGMPFSDPIADGPTIQASSQRALDRGVTPPRVLKALSQATLEVPVVLMGYYNPVLRIGPEQFALAASESGASGTIISDLTPEEAGPWVEASKRHGLDNIFLVAPTSTDARVGAVCQRSSGFVYAVSRTGVTGVGTQAPLEVARLVERVKGCTELPVCVGFGITSPDQVRTVCQVADGAVVGSWLVQHLANQWQESRGRAELIQKVAELKDATRQV